MGEVDRVRGVDGRQYTISTAQKFDTWETAVFEGGAISVSLGRNMRYVEEVSEIGRRKH